MTTFVHAALGAGVCGAIGRGCGGNRTVVGWLLIAGLFFGALPDALDFALWMLGFIERWTVYNEMHFGLTADILGLILPYRMHLVLDKWVHDVPGASWYPQYLWAELVSWVVSGGLLYVTLRERG